MKLGPGVVVDSTSVFGATLLQGPPGFPGGAAAWQTLVLGKISGGGHLGPFNADDGAGLNSGLMGSVSLDKSSQIGKDIYVNPGVTRATWSNGTPAVYVGNPSPAALASPFTLAPAAAGRTTASEMTNAADGAIAISQAFSSVMGTLSRKGASNMMNSAGCALYGNAAITDPAFATGLFNAANVSALTTNMTVASLTSEEQALVAAFYQSASGVVGGVTVSLGGRDYHGTDPQTVITPVDVEDARTIVMFLAACYCANQPGAFIYVSNGQAIANGVQAVTSMINGSSVSKNPTSSGRRRWNLQRWTHFIFQSQRWRSSNRALFRNAEPYDRRRAHGPKRRVCAECHCGALLNSA